MKSKQTLKTMIIGLDGATFDIILPLIKKQQLPTFSRLLKEGAWGELESTIPPVTAAAWTSFMTGENPGKHGIISFMQPNIASYSNIQNQDTVTTKNFSGKTFFDVMSKEGFRIGVITVPVTYPPWDINGIMISGYPCPDNDKIYSISNSISINISEPLNFGAEYYKTASEEQIIEDCIYRDKLRSILTFDLLNRYEFDCFVIVLGGIDRACHDYWKYYDPEYPGVKNEDREKFKDAIFRNYKLADEELGKFLEIYGDDVNLFIISDHGSGRHPFHFFNANLWLKNNGFLKINGNKVLAREILRKTFHGLQSILTPKHKKSTSFFRKIKPRSNVNIVGVNKLFDWENTKAFYYPLIYPADGIMINLKGRQPKGSVNPGKEYDDLTNSIIYNLLEYRDKNTGEKVIEKAFRREEIYSGPYVNNFPDIVYILNSRFVGGNELLSSIISPVPNFRLSKKSGLHLMNGIFISHGPDIKPNRIQGARIIDIAPTVLYSSGLSIPDSMDGVVLESIFKDNFMQNRPVSFFNWKEKIEQKDFSLQKEENEQMKEKLKSLGYI
ncbi:MAG: alkaline phosphatase family protein [Proteobacteria bacterium]|nr:alkaline phosphatase family protein [Pseudomonadota bacterium]